MPYRHSSSQPLWDLPLRLFHWSLVCLVALLLASSLLWESGLALHVYAGLTFAVLLFWRLLWGMVGSDTARFSYFVRPPAVVLGYLRSLFRGECSPWVGHNPAGGWMVVVMLATLLLQVVSGLPLAGRETMVMRQLPPLQKDLREVFAIVHALNGRLLMLLAGLHVTAVLLYRLRGVDLILPMLRGWRPLAAGCRPVPVLFRSVRRAALLLGAAAALVALPLALI